MMFLSRAKIKNLAKAVCVLSVLSVLSVLTFGLTSAYANDPPYAGGDGDGWTLLESSEYVFTFSINSQADQSFTVGDAATAISQINLVFTTGHLPTAASDIRITIPSGLAMTWDATDTTATIGGGALAKVSTTVSYESNNKILVLNVTSDLADTDTLEVSGLNFANFTTRTNVSYQMTMDINNDAVADATDGKHKAIFRAGDSTNQYAGGYGDGWSMAESAIFTLTSPPKTVSSAVAKGNPPVAAWDFNEGSGSTTYDEISSSDGTISGAAWKNENECHTGKCLNYDGSDDVTTVTQNSDINLTSKTGYTVVVWIRPESDGESDTGQIFYKAAATYLRVEQESLGTVKVKASLDLGSTDATVTTTSTIPTLTWSHIALKYEDDSDDEIELYINGRYVTASTNGVGSPATDSNNLLIGGSTNFKGSIDQLAIYNYARSANQIKADYSSLSSFSSSSSSLGGRKNDQNDGLVGHWKMDESTWTADSADVIDSSGAGNTGTVKGSGTDPVAGKYGKAGSFNGTTDYVTVADSDNLDFGTSTFTISAWTKSTSADYQVIISKGLNSNSSNTFLLVISGGKFRFGKCPTCSAFSATTTVNDGNWHFATVTVESTGITKLYSDGNYENSATLTQNVTSVYPVIIGSLQNSGGTGYENYFNGQIDNLRVYNKARSADQIKRDFQTGPPPNAYYKLDENTGTTVYSSSSSNTGSFASAPVWTNAKYGNGLKFDQTDDSISTNTSLSTYSSGSYSLWVKNLDVSDGNYGYLFSAGSACNTGMSLIRHATNMRYILNSNTQSVSITLADNTMVLNSWQHFEVVWDSSYVKLYLNGTLAGTDSAVDFSNISDFGNATIADGGASCGGNLNIEIIDDVRIYNYARTEKQIQQDMLGREDWSGGGSSVMAAPRADSGAVGWWDFDEGYDASAYDKSNLSNTITLSAGATGVNDAVDDMWDLTTKKYGSSAVEFDGDDYITRADDPDFDFAAADTFSISGWFKHNTISSAQSIINKYSSTAAGGWKIWMDADGDVGFGIDNDTTWTPTDSALTSSKNYDDNAWHHLVATKDGTTAIYLYVDGVQVASDVAISASATLANAAALYIGVDSDGTSNDWDDSYLDNIKIYRQLLSSLEVKTDMNNGSSMHLGYQAGADPSTSLGTAEGIGSPPVGYWSFDERTGGTVYDRSGNNKDGTFNGSWSGQGKYGPAGIFDGTDDLVSVGSVTSSLKTIEFWIKPTSTTQKLIDLNATATVDVTAGVVAANNFTGATVYVDGMATTALADTNWHQITITASTAVNASAVNFGKIASTYYAGKMDEVKMFDYVRSAAQIAYDYNKGLPVSWWKMDEGSGDTAYDYMKRNNGTLSAGGSGGNSTSQDMWDGGASGKYNRSLEFDGTNDVVSVGNLGSVGNSISVWVKPSTTTQKILELSGTAYIEIAAGVVSASGFTAPTIYIDGRPKTSFPDTNWHLVTVVDTTAVNASAMNIGKQSTTYFTGQLDDVRVYNYALSAGQVKKVYNEGSSVRFGPLQGQP